MERKNVVYGKAFFCYHQSQKVKVVSNFTKIRIQSFVSGIGTSSKPYFEGEFKFGEYKRIELELLGIEPLKNELLKGLPLLLTFAPTMPFGIFIPDSNSIHSETIHP